jgi:hypothetical protein
VANDPDETATNLKDSLKDIRKLKNNRDAIANLVEELEGMDNLSPFRGEGYHTFCEVYLIRLLRKYVYGVENQEMLLAVYGLLEGYKGKRIGERCQEYVKAAYQFDKRIDPNWDDPNGSLKYYEESINKKLIKKLMAEIFDGENQKIPLGLAEEINKELSRKFPGGFPKELPLPAPQYLLKEVGDPKNKRAEINTGHGNSGKDGEIMGKSAEDSRKRFSKRHIRKKFAVIIITIVLVAIFAFIIFYDRLDKSAEEQSANGSAFQPPARINYPDGTYIDVYEPMKIINAEDGIILVPISDDDQSMETRPLSDETNSEAVSNSEDNFDLKGVNEYEKNH